MSFGEYIPKDSMRVAAENFRRHDSTLCPGCHPSVHPDVATICPIPSEVATVATTEKVPATLDLEVDGVTKTYHLTEKKPDLARPIGLEQRKPSIYISGPMTGYPQHNFPAFFKAEETLRDVMGYETVYNPAQRGEMKGWSFSDYLKADLPFVLVADHIFCLPGWKKSRGALLEMLVGAVLGLTLYDADSWKEIPPAVVYDAFLRFALEIPDDADFGVAEQEPVATPSSGSVYQDLGIEEPIEVEARRLVDVKDGVVGERQSSYGHPLDDFSGTAKMWTGLILGKLRPGVEISPEEVAMMMVALKLRRETHQKKRDNRVDGIGYLICLDLVHKERERRLAAGVA